ncbi:hypothetical protein KV205_10230 [Streptomyces sp. SKN60]|uniref:hypothetical protein n=1 Tax=Streptomyces sp. SKN60 TaxID=2855506 RepID=UPI002247FB8C|nr:hypothetical protein [Streptomyces sp. SKN60]MCX2180905.1 hypothetical protein [Streptomyces sp. SKN60]
MATSIRTIAAADLRTSGLALLALPVGLAASVLVLVGQPTRAARLRSRLSPAGPGRWTGPRVLARTVLGLPLDVTAFVLLAYAAFNTVRNLGYPLWYADTDYHQAWGGPTLAGVWAVHSLGWLLCLAVLLHWPVRWLALGQAAVSRRVS